MYWIQGVPDEPVLLADLSTGSGGFYHLGNHGISLKQERCNFVVA